MRETTGVGLIVVLVVGMILLNHLGADVQEEAAKAQRVRVYVPVPSPMPAVQLAPGFGGWGEDAARAQQEGARNGQEQSRAVGADQAGNLMPPQAPQPSGVPGWRP
jgi:hypothetical protein